MPPPRNDGQSPPGKFPFPDPVQMLLFQRQINTKISVQIMCAPDALHAPFLNPISLRMKFLEEPGHILPEGLHGLDPFGIFQNISRVPANADVPIT